MFGPNKGEPKDEHVAYVELIEKLFDKYFLGSGTSSIRPENEVAKLIGNGAYILDVRARPRSEEGDSPRARRTSRCSSSIAAWASCRATGRS